MAKTTTFLFTNTDGAHSKSLPLYNMGEVNNYGVKNTDSKSRLTNTTGSDLGTTSEALEYKASIQQKVDTKLNIQHPAKNKSAVQYSVGLETFVETTDPENEDFIQDDPIYVQITIRHAQTSFVSEEILGQALGRAVSALQHEDGNWRFNELAKLATQPTSN